MRTIRFAGLGFLLAAAFAWGFATDRLKIFPMRLIRRAARIVGVGGWHDPAELHSRSPALASLASIPYLSGRYDPDSKLRNVVISVPGRVEPGLNFYSTLARARAYLIDNEGRVRWQWSVDRYFDPSDVPAGVDLGYPHLYPNGDVLAYVGDRALLKLDRNSNLVWKHVGRVHHDAWVCPDGTIYTLTHGSRTIPEIDPRVPSLLDSITVLSRDGKTQREISLLEVLRRSPYAFLIPRSSGLALAKGTDSIDVLHANHVEVFDGALEKQSPLYRRGNILISMKNINSVAILDGATLRILWLWGPTNLTLQHHPTLLENGNVLLFDNGTTDSEVVEVNPATDEVVWRYAPGNGFFSSIQGACQRLPAGDTLITVSQAGYALEVSPSGSIVWRFANPQVRPDGFREGIYRMTRHREIDLPFLTERPPSP